MRREASAVAITFDVMEATAGVVVPTRAFFSQAYREMHGTAPAAMAGLGLRAGCSCRRHSRSRHGSHAGGAGPPRGMRVSTVGDLNQPLLPPAVASRISRLSQPPPPSQS